MRYSLLALAFGLFSLVANADQISKPLSYTQLTPDERHIFVMLAPYIEKQGDRFTSREAVADALHIRQKYPRSGLYTNDGSVTPIWTVNWYAGIVELTNGGRYMIRRGSLAMYPDEEAFSFFVDGEVRASYAINELVMDFDRVTRTASRFIWLEDSNFDHDQLTYTILTKDGTEYVFDFSQQRFARATSQVTAGLEWWWAAGIIGCILAAFGCVAIGRYRTRRITH